MVETAHPSVLAVSYAQALLELANEAGTPEAFGEELAAIGQILHDTPELGQVLADPAIGHAEREQLLRKLFEGRASVMMLNFLLLANMKSRLSLFGSIATAYHELLDKQQGIVEVNVTVAEKLADAQLETVRGEVGKTLKREAIAHQFVDPSIIGGMVIRVGDQIIDGSIKTQLEAIRRKLLSARPE